MYGAPLSPLRFATRQLLALLALALSFALAASLMTAGLSNAAPSGAAAASDTRAGVTVRSQLDEPTLAFAGQPVQVVVSFGLPAGESLLPTGPLELVADEPGAVPQKLTLAGDEGDVRFSITPATTGRHRYTVSYSGDGHYQPARERFSYQVWTGPETRTELRASTRELTVSRPVTLTAQVEAADGRPLTGTADGPIVFTSDGVRLGEGTVVHDSRGWRAELTVRHLAVGRHRITANHESALRYFGPESEPVFLDVQAPEHVEPIEATHSVSQDGPEGSWVHSTAAVTAASGESAPTGYVQFYLDGFGPGLPVKLADRVASYDYLPLQPGTYTLRAAYLGDTRHLPAELPERTVTVPAPASCLRIGSSYRAELSNG